MLPAGRVGAVRDPQDASPAWYCSKCGAEQYETDPIILEDGRRMCANCFQDRVKELLRVSPAIVADCLGMRYEEAI